MYKEKLILLLLCLALLGAWCCSKSQLSPNNPKNLEDANAEQILTALFEETANIKTQIIKIQTKVVGRPADTLPGMKGTSVIKLKQPNKVRIETTGPIVGSDGTSLWFYWSADNKCDILTTKELADTAFDLRKLCDPNAILAQLQKEYMFQVVDKGKQWELTGMNLDGIRCTIQVSKNPMRLTNLTFDVSASYKAETRFSYKNENKKLPDSLFVPPSTAEAVVDCPLPWILLAESMEMQQNLEVAAKLMGKAAEIAPDEDVYGILLAQAKYLDQLGQYQEARTCYKKSLEHAPTGGAKSAIYFYVGMLEFRLHNYQEAIEYYHEMLRECPQAVDAWLVNEYLGHSYSQLNEPQKAQKAYVKAMKMAPTDKDRLRIESYHNQIKFK